MSEKTRIVFTGTGFMGQLAHLQNYVNLCEESGDCEVVAVSDVRESVAKQVAQRYGIPKAYKDMHEMLEKEDYDAIVCIQNFCRHEELLPEILSIGKPVMLEKPVALKAEVGDKLNEIAEKAGTKVMIGYHKRSDPATEYAKKVIDGFKASGEQGPLNEVRIWMAPGNWTYCGMVPTVISSDEVPPDCKCEDNYVDLLTEDQRIEYINIVNYYIHQINYMRHLMGEDYDVDYVSKNGCVATVTGRKTGTAGVLELGSYISDPTWDEGAKVMFDNAYVQIDLPAPLCKVPGKVQVRTKEGITSPLLETNYAMLNQARNFIKMAKGEIEPVTTITEASEDLRIALELVKKRYNL